ncbi:DUF4282 domain-containing protein [Serratia marcescens]|uniref:DUF4282 domain-containing protein n=1 Tax=Serratia marcescens TaxID=615 RepID=UPI001EEFF411|nr:DUF4282 domain-containing protein [Serratia marcescens]ULH12438.1 DUF4282 domain-containing protein [Serratia marcescens]
MLNFNTLITPKIITVIYWLSLLAGIPALLLLAVMMESKSSGVMGLSITQIILIAVPTIVIIRVFFELIMISFKNNEYLRRIADALDKADK